MTFTAFSTKTERQQIEEILGHYSDPEWFSFSGSYAWVTFTLLANGNIEVELI